jgi:hypothetical protein
MNHLALAAAGLGAIYLYSTGKLTALAPTSAAPAPAPLPATSTAPGTQLAGSAPLSSNVVTNNGANPLDPNWVVPAATAQMSSGSGTKATLPWVQGNSRTTFANPVMPIVATIQCSANVGEAKQIVGGAYATGIERNRRWILTDANGTTLFDQIGQRVPITIRIGAPHYFNYAGGQMVDAIGVPANSVLTLTVFDQNPDGSSSSGPNNDMNIDLNRTVLKG